MEPMHSFFAQNQPIIQFIYGLTFFVMGLAIALQSRSSSQLEIARSLRWLAAFGITHSLFVWGEFFSPLQEGYLNGAQIDILHFVHLFLLSLSFSCLLEFGAALIRSSRRKKWLQYLTGSWLSLYLLLILFFLPRILPDPLSWHEHAEALARYMIGFPGALLAAYGLREQTYRLITPLDAPDVVDMLRTTGIALALYAVLGGLIPPPITFFPGNWLNTETFEKFIGVPILLFLSALGVALVTSVIRALEIFQVEMERRIETMEQQQVLAAERERIGRELHDGTIQTAYTAGLLIDSARKLADADSPIATRLDRAVLVLNEVIADLRRGMGELRSQPSGETLHTALDRITSDPRFRSLVEISLEWDLAEEVALSPRDVDHILAIVYEGLSNVVRHAHARQVKIRVYAQAGWLTLVLEDDGVGMPGRHKEGFGLRNIQERARLLAGKLQIQNRSGVKGTKILLEVPLSDSAPQVERKE
jgi:signal transduction histidine kinase